MKKLIRIAILLLLFVVFPLSSWYYLKTGAEWRRSNLQDLDKLEKIPAVMYTDGSGAQHNLLEKKVCVIFPMHTLSDTLQLMQAYALFDGIYDQFNARQELRLVTVCPDSLQHQIQAYANKNRGGKTPFWMQDHQQALWDNILKKSMESYTSKRNWQPFTNFVALSDMNGDIRSVYNLNDSANIQKLVQQLAILLPFK